MTRFLIGLLHWACKHDIAKAIGIVRERTVTTDCRAIYGDDAVNYLQNAMRHLDLARKLMDEKIQGKRK